MVELSPWLLRLRQEQVVEPVQNDERSRKGGNVFGMTPGEAQVAINWGQADFDKPYRDFSPDDRVILYAYCNQKRHLVELTAVFRHVFREARPSEPILVDMGCGPFTGGLALAGVLGSRCSFDYIGMDRSDAMLRFGRKLAAAANDIDGVPRIHDQWVNDLTTVSWSSAPSWRPVIVVASYLLASRTLRLDTFVSQLNSLLDKLGRGAVTFVYTNSPKPGPNVSFPHLQKRLTALGFEPHGDEVLSLHPEESNSPEVRCALLHRPPQTEYSPRKD